MVLARTRLAALRWLPLGVGDGGGLGSRTASCRRAPAASRSGALRLAVGGCVTKFVDSFESERGGDRVRDEWLARCRIGMEEGPVGKGNLASAVDVATARETRRMLESGVRVLHPEKTMFQT